MKKKPFDKYEYYLRSVQSPEADAQFLQRKYQSLRGEKAIVLREDFCAAFALCCEWVKANKNQQAIGIDLDPETIAYGREQYVPLLSADQKSRLQLIRKDVTKKNLPTADIICALNFSYFIFKEREKLKSYFSSVLASLRPCGVFFLDCFGGSQCQHAIEEETEFQGEGFSYFWDQDSFDPVTHNALFHIHFKRKGEAKRKKVFTYDWRMWTIPELKDILAEVGFKQTVVYWEGTTKSGEGNGVFSPVTKGEECEAWVAYLAALR